MNLLHFVQRNLMNNYYGDFPNKLDHTLNKNQVRQDIDNALDIAIKINSRHAITNFLSKYIIQLKEYIGEKVDYDVRRKEYNFSYSNFDGKDLSGKLLNCWCVNSSTFQGTKFKGNGCTDNCIHWTAKNCDFTGAIFEGKICTKTSHYDGSNFTGVNLTTFCFNVSEVTMEGCNFTDAFAYDKEENKLMGKHLLKYLSEVKSVAIKDSYYTSPVDGGYHVTALDEKIWKTKL